MRKIGTGVTGRPILGNLFALNNTVSGIVPNANLVLDPDGTGKVTTDAPFEISNTTVSNSASTGSLVIDGGIGLAGNINAGGTLADSTGFSTNTNHITIPSGDTSNRPGSPSAGFTRFNTDYDLLEVYNGSKWVVSGFQDVDVSSNRTSLSYQNNWVDTSSGTITVTLPGNPSKGDEIRFFDVSNTFDTNALSIGRNGNNIMGDSENLVVNLEGAAFSLVFYNATAGWRILTI